jgi:hypothetical protein
VKLVKFNNNRRVSILTRPVSHFSSPFELVHFDVWSPISTPYKSLQLFCNICDSRMTWLLMMKIRSELFFIFQLFRKKLKLNLVNFFVFYGLTMPKNMILIFLPPIYTLKILFVRPLIFTLHNSFFFFFIGNSPYIIE